MHPFRELATMYRELAAGERRVGGKWADPKVIADLNREASRLEHLAHLDRLNGNPEGHAPDVD